MRERERERSINEDPGNLFQNPLNNTNVNPRLNKEILQAKLQQYVNFQMFKLDLEKAEEPEVKLPISVGSQKKQESSRKTSTSAY